MPAGLVDDVSTFLKNSCRSVRFFFFLSLRFNSFSSQSRRTDALNSSQNRGVEIQPLTKSSRDATMRLCQKKMKGPTMSPLYPQARGPRRWRIPSKIRMRLLVVTRRRVHVSISLPDAVT